MSVLAYFQNELANQTTQYFIFDSKGGGEHGDVDFEKYEWSPSRYNLVKTGDLIIYRRPSKASEIKEFYFFGACEIGNITLILEDRYSATFSKKYPFQKYILQSDLINFRWHWKYKGETWEHFFNQYGMNKIWKEDFVGLLKWSEEDIAHVEETDPEEEIKAIQEIAKGNYSVEDKLGQTKIRANQKAFSDKVKLIYEFTCAVCGITTKDFLIASHIVPWSINKDIRLDPSNGICLCPSHDKAFDRGYLTIDNDYVIKISSAVGLDKELKKQLEVHNGKRIKLPKVYPPKKEYLGYHLATIFKQP
jgi:putative restriction endonuclease